MPPRCGPGGPWSLTPLGGKLLDGTPGHMTTLALT